MSLESAIVAALKADSGVSAVIGSRLSPGHIPQSVDLKTQAAAYYRVISGMAGANLNGADGTDRVRVEIGVSSAAYSDVVTGSKAIVEVLDGYRGALSDVTVLAIVQDGMRDSYEDARDGTDTGIHCRAVDFMARVEDAT